MVSLGEVSEISDKLKVPYAGNFNWNRFAYRGCLEFQTRRSAPWDRRLGLVERSLLNCE
jgi:hypothetical protein